MSSNSSLYLLHCQSLENMLVSSCPNRRRPAGLARLLHYFNGMHHLEDIMYRENLRRSQIHQVLEEFSDVLTTCQRCDEMSVHQGS